MSIVDKDVTQLMHTASMVVCLAGLQPIASEIETDGVDPKEIPQSRETLGELESYSYDLTVRQAGDLNIPIIGSVSGGASRRVVVYDWSRFKELKGDNNVIFRFGYAIRFCLTVSGFDAKGKLSLSFLSAQAEIGIVQASWLMQVRGLTGSKIDSVVLPPQDLDVGTFVIAKQSLAAAIAAAEDSTTKFVPGTVVAKRDPESADVKYRNASVATFALSAVQRGRKMGDCLDRLAISDPKAIDVVTEVYSFLGVDNDVPSTEARQHAREILKGIRTED